MDQLAEISLKLLQYANTLAKEYENISINVRKNDGFVALHLECDSKRDKTRKMPSRRGAVARQRRTAKRLHERTSGYESESSSSSASGETPPPEPPDLRSASVEKAGSNDGEITPPAIYSPGGGKSQDTPLDTSFHNVGGKTQHESHHPDSDMELKIEHLAPFLPAPVTTKPVQQQQDQLLEYLDIHYKEHLQLYLSEIEDSDPPEPWGRNAKMSDIYRVVKEQGKILGLIIEGSGNIS